MDSCIHQTASKIGRCLCLFTFCEPFSDHTASSARVNHGPSWALISLLLVGSAHVCLPKQYILYLPSVFDSYINEIMLHMFHEFECFSQCDIFEIQVQFYILLCSLIFTVECPLLCL